MKDKIEEDKVAMILRGATYEEAIDLVGDINVTDMQLYQLQEHVDPILEKYGWTLAKLLKETYLRKSKLDI